jgi:outer membrane protein assembly factor BamB
VARTFRIALFLTCSLAVAHAADSVTYQVDVAHDGAIKLKKSFAPPLKLKWSRDFDGVVSYPIVVDGRAYVTAEASNDKGADLFALDLNTGVDVWKAHISGAFPFAAAAYDNDKLFVVNSDGLVRTFDAASGRAGWSLQLSNLSTGSTTAPPIASGGHVFVGGYGFVEEFYELDEANGSVVWSDVLDGGNYSAPAIDDSGALYAGSGCTDYKFDLQFHRVLWEDELGCGSANAKAPVYHDGIVYFVALILGGAMLDSTNGAYLGSFAADQPPAFWQGGGKRFEMAVVDGNLFAVDLKTGNVAWDFAGDGQLCSAPLVMNDFVAIGSQSGELYLVDAATGAEQWSANVGKSFLQPPGGLPTGLGASGNTLVAPSGSRLTAFAAKRRP